VSGLLLDPTLEASCGMLSALRFVPAISLGVGLALAAFPAQANGEDRVGAAGAADGDGGVGGSGHAASYVWFMGTNGQPERFC
jgi:hypothetical protein